MGHRYTSNSELGSNKLHNFNIYNKNIVCCESQTGSFLNNLIAEEELYFNYGAYFCVLCFFLALPCVSLQSVSVAFPGHTRLLSYHTLLWQNICC